MSQLQRRMHKLMTDMSSKNRQVINKVEDMVMEQHDEIVHLSARILGLGRQLDRYTGALGLLYSIIVL